MIDDVCLKFSIYDYFKFFEKCGIRGVAVITDKQYIFYTQMLEDDDRNHNELIIDIEEKIHPKSNKKGTDALRDNNAYIITYGPKCFLISLPNNGQLSKNQMFFINDILDEIDKYNKEGKKVLINLNFPEEHLINFKDSNTDEIRKYLYKHITEVSSNEEEIIIGKNLENDRFIDINFNAFSDTNIHKR